MASSPTVDLAALNSRTLGVTMPEITLPSGEKVQTGTVGALLIAIKAYDAAIAAQVGSSRLQSKATDENEVDQLAANIKAAVPLLKKVGMFDLFSPDEWIAGSSPGRRLVGELAKELRHSSEYEQGLA